MFGTQRRVVYNVDKTDPEGRYDVDTCVSVFLTIVA